MPILTWSGKDQIQNHRVPFHFLNKISAGNSQNMIIHADNLLALKALLPRFQNQIKCIYIDPPYNTGNESWIYNDNVNAPTLQRWLGSIVNDEDLTRHDKWLCMMLPRLTLLRDLLADDGVIFISIDDNEQANLRLICDEIFGERNFVANIIWEKKYSPQNDTRWFSDNHDFIICYAKNKNIWRPNLLPRTDEMNARYKNPDNDPRGPWQSDNCLRKDVQPSGLFTIITPTGRKCDPPSGTSWRFSKEKFAEMLADNRIWFGADGKGVPRIKRFLSEVQSGRVSKTIWLRDEVDDNQKAKRELRELDISFDTPKPTRLLEKILQLATDKNSLVVLDSFAGSGTTAHAVLNLNKADGGARRFILIELMDYAESITAERVRRVGGDFEYYELGERLLDEAGNLNAAVPVEKLREYIWYSATQEEIPASTEEKYLLGVKGDTAYYFYYEPGEKLALDLEFVRGLKTKARKYEIYAAACQLSGRQMFDFNITFHKVPRELQGL